MPEASVVSQRDIDEIRRLRRKARLDHGKPDGRCGRVSEAVAATIGYPFQWGHLRLRDDSTCWIHCWNALPDGGVLDATADQFEDLWPGDILVLSPDDPRAAHYRLAPPGRTYDPRPVTDYVAFAATVLADHAGYPQPPEVSAAAANVIREAFDHSRPITTRELELAIEAWRWQRRTDSRGVWVPADLSLGPDGMVHLPVGSSPK